MTVRQVGQVAAPLKQKVDQFQQVIDNNDLIVERIKEKINRMTPQREKLSSCVQQRQDERRSLVSSSARLEDALISFGVESAQLAAIVEELPRLLERISLPAGQQGMVTSMPDGIGPSSSSVSFAAVARLPTTKIDVSDDDSQSTWWHFFLDPEDLLTMRAASRICHDIAMQHMQSAGTAGNDKKQAVSFETSASSSRCPTLLPTSAPMPTLPTPPTTASKRAAFVSRLATMLRTVKDSRLRCQKLTQVLAMLSDNQKQKKLKSAYDLEQEDILMLMKKLLVEFVANLDP